MTDRPQPGVALRPLLAKRGSRLTGARRAVVDALGQAGGPMTVSAIHGALAVPRPDLATVYRAVNLLAEVGVLRVLHAGRGRLEARYELAERFADHHNHLVCQVCGHIEDLARCVVADEALARLSRYVSRSRRFEVTEHELRLFGRCRRCAGSDAPRARS
jgi:Fur family transcriptional regulator, ferric uptake regulator